MKGIFQFSTILFFLSIAVGAEEIEMPPFVLRSPVAMAQGGSLSSTATGYEALFINPAGFATPKLEWTISPAAFWINGDVPTFLVSSGLIGPPSGYDGPTTTFGDSTGYSDYLKSASKNGAGYGGSWGVGLVGKGLGLGLLGTTDILMHGSPFPQEVRGYFLTEIALVGGYAFVPIESDVVRWTVGVDLRPSVRFYAPLDAEKFLLVVDTDRDDSLSDSAYTAAMNGVDFYQGGGVAIDAGTRLSFGDATLSLAIRDVLNTRYSMRRYGLGDWLNEFKGGRKIPDSGEDTGDTYIVPMSVTIGFAYHLDLGSFSRYVDPLFHFEVDDPVGVMTGGSDFIDTVHFGAEVGLYGNFALRAGFDRGSLTAGAGVRFWIVEFDVAGLVDPWELGGDAVPRSGLSLGLSFRF